MTENTNNKERSRVIRSFVLSYPYDNSFYGKDQINQNVDSYGTARINKGIRYYTPLFFLIWKVINVFITAKSLLTKSIDLNHTKMLIPTAIARINKGLRY